MKIGYLVPRLTKIMVIISLVAVALLLFLLTDVFIFKNDSLDNALFSFGYTHRSPATTRLMRTITFLGNFPFLIPLNFLLLLIFLLIKERWWAIRITVISLTTLILMSLLKNLVGRHRPTDSMIDGLTNFSFPSGHATMSVAFYGLLICWFDVTVKNKAWRIIITSLLLLLILLIGYSRIYLRVHYASDVLAGYCMGTIWLIFCFGIVKGFETRQLAGKK